MQAYREFCDNLDKKLEECIMDDLRVIIIFIFIRFRN